MIPLAEPFGLARNVDRDGAAVSFAGIRLAIVHALGVGFATSRIESVSDIAASVAVTSDLIPDAHGGKKRAFGLVAEGADLLALTSDGIEAAVSVLVAAGLAHAAGFTGRLTDGCRLDIQPLASRDGSACAFRSEASALGVAELSRDVPLASEISTTSIEGGVAVGTLFSADTSCTVPDARTSSSTDIRSFEESALLAALATVRVPEAARVGRAGSSFIVGISAGGNADIGDVEPHAVRHGLAGDDLRRTLEGGAAA